MERYEIRHEREPDGLFEEPLVDLAIVCEVAAAASAGGIVEAQGLPRSLEG